MALGTIYRYFSSKDHLLAAAQVLWVRELEQRVTKRPPSGETTSDRVVSVLRRATRAMENEPKLSAVLVTAISSPDPGAAACQRDMSESMSSILGVALGDDFDPAFKVQVTNTLGYVWLAAADRLGQRLVGLRPCRRRGRDGDAPRARPLRPLTTALDAPTVPGDDEGGR